MTNFIPWRKVDLPLKAQRSIWISTTRPDGRPHAVPVWYIWDGTNIYFITRRDMQKAKNLRIVKTHIIEKNPEASTKYCIKFIATMFTEFPVVKMSLECPDAKS